MIEAVNLQIQEAALTGESVPVEKHAAALNNPELALGDRKNMAYAGTAATYDHVALRGVELRPQCGW